MPPRISIRESDCLPDQPFVGPSVGLSLGPSVTHFECAKTRLFNSETARGWALQSKVIKGASKGMTRGDASDGRVSGLVSLFGI